MAPRKRTMSQIADPAQAPGDNVRKPRVAAHTANSNSRKRKRVVDRSDEAETSQARVRRPKWSRIVGRLAGLMEMPMDILFEIFGHLKPLDVLRLARTTKQFRRILMHRSSVSIWIAARKNVPNLPDCPPYLSEPQFANLVFDTHCHECLSPNIRSVDWRIGRRICAKCAKECMVEDYSLFVGESVYKSVPSKYGKRGRPSYYAEDLHEFQNKRSSFTVPQEREKFVKERQALVVEMEKHGAMLEAWATNQAKDRSEQLEDLRRERKEAIIEKLTELGWGPEIAQIPDRDDLSHHKLVRQPTRLTPRIWANIQAEMVVYMKLMKTHRLERERKALVISRKRIAVSILRDYKLSRLPLTDVMPEPMDFCAISQVSEILELPTETQVTEDTFAPIVERMDELVGEWRTQILRSLVQKVKDSLYPHKSLVEQSRDSTLDDTTGSKVKGKAKAVEPSIPDDSRILQDLSLATTVFNCKSCNPRFGISYGLYGADFGSDTDSTSSEDDFLDPFSFGSRRRYAKTDPLFFPKVLGHHCLTKQHGYIFESDGGGDPTKQYDYPTGIGGSRTRWSCNLLRMDERASGMAANVITTCGLDPETMTTVEMDRLNRQLACLECLEWSDDEWNKADAPVFDWRTAVAHHCQSHPNNINVEWKLIEGDLAQDVVNIEGFQGFFSSVMFGLVGDSFDPSEEVAWLCAHCLDLPSEVQCQPLTRMKSHLSAKHSVSEPQENRDYYKDYQAPQGHKARSPRLKITLTLPRPDDVPGPGERHLVDPFDPWGFGALSDDELEEDYFYNDDFF